MGSHPINLAFRFLLELTALAVFGIWGWQLNDGWTRFVLAFVLPVLAAALWGIFAVPNDPSRSGAAPVPVPGFIRLMLELAFFALATYMVYDLGYSLSSTILGAAVVIHYLLSYDRVHWLFQSIKSDKK